MVIMGIPSSFSRVGAAGTALRSQSDGVLNSG
jgi:hypothetical protein